VAAGTKLVVLGQGYVGLPLAMRAVEVGFDVVGYDVDTTRVARLGRGDSYIDDVDDATLGRANASGRYLPTADAAALAGFDVAVISVPTPLREGSPDLSFIEDAARTVGRHVRPGVCVVLESTTYPGTTEELVKPILEDACGLAAGGDFHLGYSPERLDPGNTEWTLVTTPKVVSGIDDESLAAVRGFYDKVVDRTVPVSSPKEAELTKLLENTFRHVNIALVNELAMFAHDLGIDIWEAIDAASTKPFGYMRFQPGPGVGGHCLPVDPSYLSWRVRRSLGHWFRFVELANDVNDNMPEYVVRRLVAAMNRRGLAMNGRRVVLAGFTYKRNTSDARETPSRVIARHLVALGSEVQVVDAHVDPADVPGDISLADHAARAFADADAVVLVVDHDDLDYDAIGRATYVLDCRHRVFGPNVEQL
jgi:UDP-N-acetyl-D-glucosamine dehydrogenase